VNDPKPGRPSVLLTDIVQMVEDIVTKNSTTRTWSCGVITTEVATRMNVEKSICAKSVYKILKAKKYKSCKQTAKPGLIDKMKKKR
jgi:hypothetical protein